MGKIGGGDQEIQPSNYKTNKSLECNIEYGDSSQ